MNKFETNPFDRSALKDSTLLAGRNDELRQIRFILRNSSKQKYRFKHLLITGNRGVGKTSFLNIIENESHNNNIIPIRIDLTLSNSINSNEFFWHIFNQVTRTIFKLDFFGGKNGIVDQTIQRIINSGTSDVADWVFHTPLIRYNYLKNNNFPFDFNSFIDDMRIIIDEIKKNEDGVFDENSKLVFIIDESQNIFHNTKLIEEIRFIIQQPELAVGFVFAGDNSYRNSKWEIVFGGTHREFEILNLNYFSNVSSVNDYFYKSLSSIGWSSKDIEEVLFYRFHKACIDIYTLTSGKPAWINVIASKMFERCMKEESAVLRFDKQAQQDVKNLLSEGGYLDTNKLQFINSLTPKLSKWLSFLFACELSTLKQVYFYAKFILTGSNFLEKNEFKSFCKSLNDSKIITIIPFRETKAIGYSTLDLESEFLDQRYYAFDEESDTLKQWLQISSNGEFHFSVQPPAIYYINRLNSEIVCEGYRSVEVLHNSEDNYDEDESIVAIIEALNKRLFDVENYGAYQVHFFYKLFKRLNNSKERQILSVELINLNSKKANTWLLYNFDENKKIIGFNCNQTKIDRYRTVINNYNNEIEHYDLNISIQNLPKPNIEIFQELILKSKDSKKMQYLIDDKHEELIDRYIKEKDADATYKVACFFKNLFEAGHDLDFNNLNNTAYVFIMKNEYDIAINLLSEAKRKIYNGIYEAEDKETIPLILYNYAILLFKKDRPQQSLIEFRSVLSFMVENEIKDKKAGVLFVLNKNESDEIVVEEIWEDNPDRISIDIEFFCNQNISLLEKFVKQII